MRYRIGKEDGKREKRRTNTWIRSKNKKWKEWERKNIWLKKKIAIREYEKKERRWERKSKPDQPPAPQKTSQTHTNKNLWVCTLWSSLDFAVMCLYLVPWYVVPGLPGSSLVLANVSPCLCLALGSLAEALRIPKYSSGWGLHSPEAGSASTCSWIYLGCFPFFHGTKLGGVSGPDQDIF